MYPLPTKEWWKTSNTNLKLYFFSQFYSTMALIYLFQHKQNIYLCDGPYKYLARPNWKFRQNCYWVITLFKYISSLFNIAIWKTRVDFVTYYSTKFWENARENHKIHEDLIFWLKNFIYTLLFFIHFTYEKISHKHIC